MSQITLYGVGFSPFVRKVMLVLKEKGLPFEHVPMTPRDLTPELRKHTPLGKIPFARIGDLWLPDSSIICTYLERKHPNPPLYPRNDEEYVRALWFEEFIDAGAVAKLGGSIYFERILAPRLAKRPPDEAKINKAIAEDVPLIYNYLNNEVGQKQYLVGDRYTIADIAVASFFVNMKQADVPPDPARWPNLARYIQHHHARPALAAMIAVRSTFEAGKQLRG